MDPYQTLNVSKDAKLDEIKNAYRKLAKKYHPDLNPGNKAAETKFKDIAQAYEMIGTEEARAKFDRGETEEAAARAQGYGGARSGPYYYQTQGGASPGGGPFSQGRYSQNFGQGFDEGLFESIFGNARSGRSQRGGDELYQMEVELKEAVLGGQKEVTLPDSKKISLKIPAGIKEGARLRLSGQGASGADGKPAGDAFIEIHIRPDARFKQQEGDLLYELPVSFADAILGAELRVPTLEGEVLLRIPPHSNTDRKLRLRGKGAIHPATRQRGDEIVVLKVMLPERIDPELESFARNWAAKHSGHRAA